MVMHMLKCALTGFAVLATAAFPTLAAHAGTTALNVPSAQYPTIAAAVAAANLDTDLTNQYVISIAPGTYTNDTAEIDRAMTIQAAQPGSAVILNETAALPNEKGILLAYAPLTVDGLTFQNAWISNDLGGNGAGIRDQDGSNNGTLTVRNSTFINNQMGILTANGTTNNVVLDNNLFMNNGNLPSAGPFGHAVYIGPANSLTASDNEVCGTNVGHDIKSRAAVNIIENNTLYDGAADPNQPNCSVGSSSYALDLPNGGEATVTGNTMVQGASTQNGVIFAYGEEGIAFSANSIGFSNNVMQNSGVSGAVAIYDNPSAPVSVQGSGNTFDSSLIPVYPASANQLDGSVGSSAPPSGSISPPSGSTSPPSVSSGGSTSPDGTVLTAPSNGSLTTEAGTWTLGSTQPEPGQSQIYLNGSYAYGWGSEMEVANGGQLYVNNSYENNWWVWNNGSWLRATAP